MAKQGLNLEFSILSRGQIVQETAGEGSQAGRDGSAQSRAEKGRQLRQPVEKHRIGKTPVLILVTLFCVDGGGEAGLQRISELKSLERWSRNRLGISIAIFFVTFCQV